MGCNNGKMVRVEPQIMKEIPVDENAKITDKNNNGTELEIAQDKRMTSATSKISRRSEDSAFIEGDGDSVISTSRSSSRANSGGLKRTLRGLSGKSQRTIAPLKDENSVLQQLRSEGLLLESNTQQAKSGLSFNLLDEASQPRKTPARLKALEKRQKRRKLLTQHDIEEKLEKAEQRRKEAEAERVGKIQSVTAKSDIHNALDSFVEHQKQIKEQVQEKVDTAAENRAKKLQEMRDKLRAREEHAAMVRNRKQSLGPLKINDGTAEQPVATTEFPPLNAK